MDADLFNRLYEAILDYPFANAKVKNSDITRALASDVLEMQNLARILAKRRGIQLVKEM